ncbi:MAG: hypothetical protein B6229_02450 [Spirochaetaceae bacterium 4572_7]|nr:MAG: hypothetical protein B6229_02450 [Spirochaetaceae bacterium 4572_7]
MSFMNQIKTRWVQNNTLLCVGLDPDIEKIPEKYRELETPLFAFNKDIIDATEKYVCCYKPQIAYYNGIGKERDLELTIEYIHKTYPGIPVILDGAIDLQDLEIAGEPLYMQVAKKAASKWNKNSNVLLVVGATYPEELAKIRAVIGDIPFLTPGIGAQGGDVEKAVKAGTTTDGTGMIINSSRGIIYAENPGVAAKTLRDEINLYR